MEVLLAALENPGDLNQTEWLVICIALFVLVAGFYFVFRVFRIARSLKKSRYQPNIGRARLKSALHRHRK